MPLLETALTYFQGEKIEALVFILPIGLLSVVFGAWLWTDGGGSFARGVAIPFLLMGLLMTTIGTTVGYRAPSQVQALEVALKASPESAQVAREREAARMLQVNRAWNYYLVVWALFGLAGLVLRFALTSDFAHGLGIALVFFSGVGLLVDGFAERRTHAYSEALGIRPSQTAPR